MSRGYQDDNDEKLQKLSIEYVCALIAECKDESNKEVLFYIIKSVCQ